MQEKLDLPPRPDEQLDIGQLEQWLWGAACSIRGAMDAPKYKDFILPLVFYRRLSDVFDDEFRKIVEQFEDVDFAAKLVQENAISALRTGSTRMMRFYVPHEFCWDAIRHYAGPESLGAFITTAMREVARLNPTLDGVVNVRDFAETQSGQRILADDRLGALVETIGQHRLGLLDTEPDVLGRAYEYLLRKFAEGQGQSAGEFYTPKEVAVLMAVLMAPGARSTVYDPTCGSGGLLIKARMKFDESHPDDPSQAPKLYGQELNSTTFALAKMNMILHDYADHHIAIGDTMTAPAFANGGVLRQFDLVLANPMWNQTEYGDSTYQADPWSRFPHGMPPQASADWGWLQHILASLKDDGRAAVVLDTNVVNRGSGAKSHRERDIRREVVDAGLVSGVVLLPENLFYNTGAPAVLLVLDKSRPRGDAIRLVNASRLFEKGQPKSYLGDDHIALIARTFQSDEDVPGLATTLPLATIQRLDYDLSPNRHITVDVDIPALALPEALDGARRSMSSLSNASIRAVDAISEFVPAVGNAGAQTSSWVRAPLSDVVSADIAGDWGTDAPDANDEYVHCAVIRGTDFPDVGRGRLAGVRYRYVKQRAFDRKQLRVGDLLIETSGGGKYQNTGRVLLIDSRILDAASLPLLHTNFTRLLRVDTSRVIARYVYHCWQRLYDLGRTARYERQPTNIKNFKYRDFMEHEFIMYPLCIEVQGRIADALDAISAELRAQEQHAAATETLRRASMGVMLHDAPLAILADADS